MSGTNSDEIQRLRELADQNRIAKLRALGREMELRARLDLLKQQAESKEQELTAEIEQRNRELENSRAELRMLVNSRSWKLTRPLRQITELTRTRQVAGDAPDSSEKELPRNDAGPQRFEASTAKIDNSHQPQSSADIDDSFLTAGKAAWDEVGTRRLNQFLDSDRRLTFPTTAAPAVSIVVVLYNKAHLGFLCIELVLRNAGLAYELVLIDNASTDHTGQLLDRLDGATVVRNSANMGFGYGCMQGAEQARGEFLCFLNNDALLSPGSLEAAIADFRERQNVGAVGGKILFADGGLQEAGSIVWQDGTTWGYGRGDDPELPRYQFRRPVDYCSAAFLLTPRALFNSLGGFDERFLPAYYEDTDYCFKVWDKGLKVLYEPRAAIHHYESASFEDTAASKAAIAKNRAKFADKWQQRLLTHSACGGEKVPYARFAAQAGGARILYMGSEPLRKQRSASTSGNDFVARHDALGHHVTCVSMTRSVGEEEQPAILRDVELANATAETHYVFRELLSQYDVVWVEGGKNMRELLWHLWNMDERIPPIVYQPEAVTTGESATREPEGSDDAGTRFEKDITLCQAADIVMVESDSDRRLLLEHRITEVYVLSDESIEKVLAEVSTRAAVPHSV